MQCTQRPSFFLPPPLRGQPLKPSFFLSPAEKKGKSEPSIAGVGVWVAPPGCLPSPPFRQVYAQRLPPFSLSLSPLFCPESEAGAKGGGGGGGGDERGRWGADEDGPGEREKGGGIASGKMPAINSSSPSSYSSTVHRPSVPKGGASKVFAVVKYYTGSPNMPSSRRIRPLLPWGGGRGERRIAQETAQGYVRRQLRRT